MQLVTLCHDGGSRVTGPAAMSAPLVWRPSLALVTAACLLTCLPPSASGDDPLPWLGSRPVSREARDLLAVVSDSLELRSSRSGRHRVVSRLHAATMAASSELCRAHTTILWESLRSELWAFAMIDASGKLPDGILQGNVMALGSWDECLGLEVALNASRYPDLPPEALRFSGRYALAVVAPRGQHGWLGRSRLGGPVLPAVTGVGFWYGMCIPSSCSAADLAAGLQSLLGASFTVTVPSSETADEPTVLSSADKLVISICAVVGLLMVAGTAAELFRLWQARHRRRGEPLLQAVQRWAAQGEDADVAAAEKFPLPPASTGLQCLMAFSVYSNGRRILSTSHAPGTITCLHGIRFFSMTWVLLGHSFDFIVNAQNGLMRYDWAKNWNFSVVLNAYPAVDTFFLLSGLVLAYVFIGRYERSRWFSLPLFYLHRYLRLTPPYAIMMAVTATWYVYLMDGPLWHAWNVDHLQENCQNYWWHHLLYIQNFYSVDEECLWHAWYLATDMQLFVLSPLVLLPLVLWRPLLGYLWTLAVFLGLMVARAVVWVTEELPPDRNQLRPEAEDRLDDIYESAWARAPVWLMGVALGVLLRRLRGRRVPLRPWQTALSWAAALATGLAVEYGLMGYRLPWQPYNTAVSVAYGVFHRVAWGAAVCWVIFACVNGSGGWVQRFLAYPGFLPLSRLTYSAYLVHISVLIAGTLSAKGTVYYDLLRMTYLIFANVIVTFAVAFVLSLSFELPFMNIEKIVIPERKSVKKTSN